jgi:hypothetical protein
MNKIIPNHELLKLGFKAEQIYQSDDALDDCIYQVFKIVADENIIEITNDLNEKHEIIKQYLNLHIECEDIKEPSRILGEALHLLNCIEERYITGKAKTQSNV